MNAQRFFVKVFSQIFAKFPQIQAEKKALSDYLRLSAK